MKKFIFFLIGMLMMLSLSAIATQSTSRIVDNKASPPEISTSNYYLSVTLLVAADVEVVPAPPVTWGYNNVMTNNEETATPIIPASTRILRFFGPGDSFVLGYPELNNVRCFAFEDFAFDPPMEIGGQRIV